MWPWVELEKKIVRKKFGGYAFASASLPQNRDRMGASNIGFQFRRLYEGKSPIRRMTGAHAGSTGCTSRYQ